MKPHPLSHLRSLAKPTAIAILSIGSALGLAACGSSDSSTDSAASSAPSASSSTATSSESTAAASPSAEPEGASLDIKISGGKITPTNASVKASLGEPFTLQIDSDVAGELHVHSDPEQHIAFEQGSSTKELTFENPGVIAIEDHDTDTLIAKLQVS